MRTLIQNYFAGREWFCLAFVVIVIIWLIARKKKTGEMRWYFGVPMLLFALICLNPFVAEVLEDKFSLSTTYYRLFWIVPFELVLAIAVTWMIFRHKKIWGAILAAVAVVIAIGVVGDTSMNELYARETNVQRVNEMSKQVDEVIKADRTDDESVVLYDLDRFLDLRIYDPSILSVMDRKQALGWNVEPLSEEQQQKILKGKNSQKILSVMLKYGAVPESEKFWYCIEKKQVDYIVVTAPIDLDAYLDHEGMTRIYQDEYMSIYRCG